MHRSLPQVGSQTINTRRTPVYALPNGREAVEITDERSGHAALISVEGAKTFKNGQYPLHPELVSVVAAEFYGEQPFALRPVNEQDASAQRLLSSVLDRLLSSGLPFNPSAN